MRSLIMSSALLMTSTMSSRFISTASQMSSSIQRKHTTLSDARALYCMSFSGILWESLTVQKVRASMNPVNKLKQLVFVLEAAAAVDDLLDSFQRELKETLDDTDDAMRKLWHLRLALRKEINTNFKDPRASESDNDNE